MWNSILLLTVQQGWSLRHNQKIVSSRLLTMAITESSSFSIPEVPSALDIFHGKYCLSSRILGTSSGPVPQILVGFRNFDKKRVAVKFIDRLFSTSEIGILKTLDHSNIVKLLDYYEDAIVINQSLQSILVMECMDGGNLCNWFKSKPRYCVNEVRELTRGLLRSIVYIHQRDIIHRDIKLDNILLKKKNIITDVKLADFGIAIQIPPEGDIYSPIIFGSSHYIAPEVLLRQRYGKAVDMWSLGVTIYILLCGQFPFATDEEVLTPNLRFSGEELSRLSLDACNFLLSLLRFNPAERLTAKQALSHPWLSPCSPFEEQLHEQLGREPILYYHDNPHPCPHIPFPHYNIREPQPNESYLQRDLHQQPPLTYHLPCSTLPLKPDFSLSSALTLSRWKPNTLNHNNNNNGNNNNNNHHTFSPVQSNPARSFRPDFRLSSALNIHCRSGAEGTKHPTDT